MHERGSRGVIGWGRVRGRVGQCEKSDEKPSSMYEMIMISSPRASFVWGDDADGGRVRHDMA